MHVAPQLTPAALRRRARITELGKKLVLASNWRGRCATNRKIRVAAGPADEFPNLRQ